MPDSMIEQESIVVSQNGTKPVETRVKAEGDLTREYASSSGRNIAGAIIQSLPAYISDLDRVFGTDLWDRIHGDPQTSSTVNILRAGAVSRGFRLAVHEDIPEEEQVEAQKYVDICQADLGNLEHPLPQVMWELSAAVYKGYEIAELIFAVETPDPKEGPRLVLKDIKTKPHNMVAVVTDDKNNVLGFLPALPGMYSAPTAVTLDAKGDVPNLLPRDKFVLVSNDPQYNNPQGTSAYRQVYDAWWHKRQLLPEYLQFLATQATPSVKITLAEGAAVHTVDNVEIDPVDEATTAGEEIRNGGVAVIPFGAEMDYLQSQSQGDVFIKAFEFYNKEITRGLTGQTLATDQADYDTLGASQTHQDVLFMPSDRLGATLAYALRNDVVRVIMRVNYGEEIARKYTPAVLSGETEQQDFAAMASAIKTLADGGLLDEPDAMAWAAEKLGMPFDKAAYVERLAENKAMAQEIASGQGQGTEEAEDGEDEQEAGGSEGANPFPPKGGQAKFYSPDQPRDEAGRFGEGGGSGSMSSKVMGTKEAQAWAEEQWPMPAESGMTDSEEDAVRAYSRGGFREMNRFARTGQAQDLETTQFMVEQFDNALQRMPVPEAIQVVRGVDLNAFGGTMPDQLVGSTLLEKGYMSTSVGDTTHESFSYREAQMKINVPKGTPAYYTARVSGSPDERELTLARNLKYVVRSASYDKNTGRWNVEADITKD